jgi:cell division protein FtsZ
MPTLRTRFTASAGEQRVRVKLFGVGSAGCSMIDGARFPTVAVSASAADLARCRSERRVLIGQERLAGLSDSGPELMRKLPALVGHELLDVFNNTEIAFIMCGLGGTTGSLGARMLASVAKAKGSLGIVLAATPFTAESVRRREFAEETVRALIGTSSLCVEFSNDKLSSMAPNLPLSRAFAIQDAIMMRPVMDLCATFGRTDAAAFREVLGGSHYGRFGLGLARGDDRVERAVHDALTSPWFDFDLGTANAAIVVYSAADPWDREEERVLSAVADRLPSSNLVVGSYPDPTLGERIRVSVIIARGCPAGSPAAR